MNFKKTAIASSLVAMQLLADTTWTGTTADWNTSSNWGSGVPTSSVNAIFPEAATTKSITLSSAGSVNNIQFTGATAYTIGGSATPALTIYGTTLNVGSNAPTFNSNLVIQNAITISGTAPNLIFNGSVLGNGGFSTTNGSLTFNGSASFSGNTTLNVNATLISGAQNSFSPNSVIDASNTAGVIQLNGHDNKVKSVKDTVGNSTISLGSNTLTLMAPNGEQFIGAITGTGGLTIQNGTFNLAIYTGTQPSYTGATIISNSGVLKGTYSDNGFAANSDVTINTSGQMDLNGWNQTVGSINGDSTGVITLSTGKTLTFGSASAGNYGGKITGAGGLTKQNGSTATFSGSNRSDYSGATLVSAGTLASGAAGAFSPNSVITVTGALTNSFNNTILGLTGAGQVNLSANTLTLGSSPNPTQTSTFSGKITGSGNLTLANTTTLTLSGTTNDYTGATIISGGSTLKASAGSNFAPNSPVQITTNGTLDINQTNNTIGTLSGDQSGQILLGTTNSINLTINQSLDSEYDGIFTGSPSNGSGGALLMSGDGVLSLGQLIPFASKFGGGLAINSISTGGIRALTSYVLPANALLDFTNSGGVLEVYGCVNEVGGLNGGGSSTEIKLTAVNGVDAVLEIGNTTVGYVSGYNGKITGEGSCLFNGTQLTLTPPSSNANTYSGKTILIGSGSLIAGSTNAFSANSPVSVSSISTLSLGAGFSNEIANLTGSGTVTAASGTPILTLGSDNNSTTFSGTISNLGITKKGTGVFTLSGANSFTYSGDTQILAGTILLGYNAYSSTSNVIISPNAVLNLGNNNTTVASISGTGGAVSLGTGNLTLNTASGKIFSGGFSGTGFITINATGGTYTMSGSGLSNYSGITYVGGGILAAGATNAFSNQSTIDTGTFSLGLSTFANEIGGLQGTAGATVTGSGALTVGRNNADTTFGGIISSSGGVTKVGTGTLTLSGVNTFLGGLNLSGGTISISAASGVGSSANVLTFNNGALANTAIATLTNPISLSGSGTLSNSANLTLSGAITGSGALSKNGSSTLIVGSTSNTYSGNTTLTAGTLQASLNSVFSPNSLVILQNSSELDNNGKTNTIKNLSGTNLTLVNLGSGTLTLGDSTSQTFSGIISGATGNLIKTGSGLLNLTGSNTYSGNTTIQAGTLAVNGSIQSATTVASGATLQGTGSITGNVTVNGTTSPGNSIGTLNVNGNYTANSGSNLIIELSPSVSDKIYATGSFTVQPGASIQLTPLRGHYPSTYQAVIVQADGGRSGTFTNVVEVGARLAGDLIYNSNQIIYEFTIKTFTEVGLGFNARQVASVVDNINQLDPVGWTEILDTLFGLSNSDLNLALNELDPAELKALALISQNNMIRIEDGIRYRFQNLMDQRNCEKQKKCVKKSPVYIWVDGFNTKIRQDSRVIEDNPQYGYHTQGGGGSFGIDFNFLKDGYFGLIGSGTYTDVDYSNNQGKAYISSGYFGLYGSYMGPKKYLNLSMIGAVNDYTASRNIEFPGFFKNAKSDHKGYQLLSHVDAGLIFNVSGIEVRPFEWIDYIIEHQTPLTETGAGVLSLHIQSNNPQIVRNELGLNFGKCYSLNRNSRLLTDLKLSWVYEARIKGRMFTSNFTGYTPETFLTEGYFPYRNLFAPGASVTFNFANGKGFIMGSYDAEMGYKYLDQRVGAQIAIQF